MYLLRPYNSYMAAIKRKAKLERMGHRTGRF